MFVRNASRVLPSKRGRELCSAAGGDQHAAQDELSRLDQPHPARRLLKGGAQGLRHVQGRVRPPARQAPSVQREEAQGREAAEVTERVLWVVLVVVSALIGVVCAIRLK